MNDKQKLHSYLDNCKMIEKIIDRNFVDKNYKSDNFYYFLTNNNSNCNNNLLHKIKNADCAKLLIEKYGIDPNIENDKCQTPIFFYKTIEALEYLKSKGCLTAV